MELAHHIFNRFGSRNVAIIGIGNVDRGDDGFGIRVAETLQRSFPENVYLESDGIEEIIRTINGRSDIDYVLFLDTIETISHPGKIEMFEKEMIGEISSSHEFPVKLYCALIEKPSLLIGIQPKTIEFGNSISYEVQKGIERTIAELSTLLREE